MKKEIIIAILIGIILGLIITYGIYTSRTAQENNQQTKVDETVISKEQEVNLNQLAVHQPLEGAVVEEKNITVAGTSLANNFIVIFVGDQETITQADESGNFSTNVELSGGGNIITIYAIDETGQKSKIERSVILDNAETKLTEQTDEEATASAETEE